jgi:hypothetical protein
MNEDEAAAELSRILGERCAGRLLPELLDLRDTGVVRIRVGFKKPPAHMCRDAAKVAEMAEALAALLSQGSLAPWLRSAELEAAAQGGQFAGVRVPLEDRLRRTAGDLKSLAELAAVLRDRQGRPGPSLDDKRVYAMYVLAIYLSMFGHALSVAENSKFVRAARICWPLLGFAGDARDALRRAIKGGALDLGLFARQKPVGGELLGPPPQPTPGGESTAANPKLAP